MTDDANTRDALRAERAADPRSVDALIRDALARYADEDWPPEITILQARGTAEVLAAAQALCTGETVVARQLGADILGQLGWDSETFVEERLGTLTAMLAREHDESVLASILYALGHLHDARISAVAAPWHTHANVDIREAVAYALGGYDDPLAISTLITLTRDAEAQVRDWATFSLAQQTDADSPAIRDALVARLGDDDLDTWSEALLGLARRQDPRVVDALLATRAAGFYGPNTIEAALLAIETFTDQRLCGLLQWLLEQEDSGYREELKEALARYCPSDH